MKRSAVTLVTFLYVLFSRTSGAEVEMKIRPGENVTLQCDCAWKTGFNTVWFRNTTNQEPLVISVEDLIQGALSRYSFVWNPFNRTNDLLVKNVSESDLGLYYCAVHEKKITEDKIGRSARKNVYHYGNRITRLSLLDTDVPPATPTPPVSDCSVCWKLLVSVCPVCVLLSSVVSSTCVYCICSNTTKGSEERRELLTVNVFQVSCPEEHQCERSMNGKPCFHTQVSYTPLKSELKSD